MSDPKPGPTPTHQPSSDDERVTELEHELARVRALVNRSRDMVMLHDVRGKVLESNRFAHEVLGYTREEFLELHVADFNPDVAAIPPERLGDNWSKMPLGTSVTVETDVTHRDGTAIPIELVIAPFEEGGVRQFVALGRDISERRAAEAARRRDEMRFQAIFEGAPTGLALIDEGEMIVAANPALEKLLGMSSGQLLGSGLSDITYATDIYIGREELIDLYLGRREHVRIERRFCAASGEIVWGELSAFRFQAPDTDEQRTVVFIDDIGDRKRIEKERRAMFERLDELVAQRTAALEQEIAERKRTETQLSKAMRAAESANLAKSQFLASMSHELRTPLNAVIGYSEMLIEEAEETESEELVPDLERIRNAGKHLLGLINDILDLSKVEAGKIELYIESVELDALVTEVESMIHPLAKSQNNALEVLNESDVEAFDTDHTRIRQIIFNLMSNACKFTEGGKVKLHIRELYALERTWLVFDVVDTGLGIKPEQIEKLFKPFTQADASTSRRYGGTGLGLSISASFAKLLGGRIEVKSEYGSGSTFSLWLPVSKTSIIQPEAEHSDASWPRVDSLGRILVVDDERDSRTLLARLLEMEGYTVMTASTGARALELAETHRPDAITLDVMMPGMDGWTVLDRLKSNPLVAEIPVVIVSAAPDLGMGFALGATDVMSKPIERERLLGMLGDIESGGGHKHVLVVDDDDHARDLVSRAVLKEGWHVQEANNGLAALEAMRARKPKLVILDLMMPEMDGFEVLEHLRADPALRSLPVIVVTAKQLSEEERSFLSRRVGSIMQKGSYSRSNLVEHLHSLISHDQITTS